MKFFCLLLKSALDRCGFINPFLCRISSNVFGDAHGAKMSSLGTFGRECLTNLMPIIFALAGLTVISRTASCSRQLP